MKKLIIGGIGCVVWIVFLAYCLFCSAATSTETKHGANKYVQKVTFFDGFNVGGTYGTTTGYVYDSPDLTSATDGWIEVNGTPLAKATRISVILGVDSITSGTRTARIEGRGVNTSRPYEILTVNYTAATGIDEVFPIVAEAVTDIRIGWNCSEATADDVHAYAIIEKSE